MNRDDEQVFELLEQVIEENIWRSSWGWALRQATTVLFPGGSRVADQHFLGGVFSAWQSL